MAAIGRNQPCPCGSGKKYKHCCLLKSQKISWNSRIAIALISLILIIGAVVALSSIGGDETGNASLCPAGTVWSASHGHCH